MTPAPRVRGVLGLVLRVIGWSVAMFALWYLAARPVSLAVAWGSAALLQATTPVERARPRWSAGHVVFEVEFDGATTYRERVLPGAIFELDANPMRQAFGLPFFIALLLASRPPRLAGKMVLGAAIVFALAVLGAACEVAIDLAKIAPAGAPLVRFDAVAATLIALGYQLGTLVFPTVVPVMLWLAMDPRYLRFAGDPEGPDNRPA